MSKKDWVCLGDSQAFDYSKSAVSASVDAV